MKFSVLADVPLTFSVIAGVFSDVPLMFSV